MADDELNVFGGMGASKQEKQILAKDVADMRKGQLGLSQGEKGQAQAAAQQAAAQQAAAQQTLMNRQAAGQGGAVTGAQMQNIQNVGANAQEVGAQVSQRIDEQSQRLAQARREAIMQRLALQAQRQRENRSKALRTGVALAGSAATGGALGLLKNESGVANVGQAAGDLAQAALTGEVPLYTTDEEAG